MLSTIQFVLKSALPLTLLTSPLLLAAAQPTDLETYGVYCNESSSSTGDKPANGSAQGGYSEISTSTQGRGIAEQETASWRDRAATALQLLLSNPYANSQNPSDRSARGPSTEASQNEQSNCLAAQDDALVAQASVQSASPSVRTKQNTPPAIQPVNTLADLPDLGSSPIIEFSQSPVIESPIVESPGAESPGVESPDSELLPVDLPTGESPEAKLPAVESLGTELPGAELPGAEPLMIEPSAAEFPTIRPTLAESPGAELPGAESPAMEPPVLDAVPSAMPAAAEPMPIEPTAPAPPAVEPPPIEALPAELPAVNPTPIEPTTPVPPAVEPAPPAVTTPVPTTPVPATPLPLESSPLNQPDPSNVTPTTVEPTPFDGSAIATLSSRPDGNYRYLAGTAEFRVYTDAELQQQGGSVFILRKEGNNITGNLLPRVGQPGMCVTGIVSGNTVTGSAYPFGNAETAAETGDEMTLQAYGNGALVVSQTTISQTDGLYYARAILDLSNFSMINAGVVLPPVRCGAAPVQ